MMTKRLRLGLVIGSGGLKCAAAIGVMHVLEEASIGLDLIVGCSGGAVFGASIALGYSSQMMAEAAARAWTSDVTKQLDLPSLAKMLLPGLFGFEDEIGVFDDRFMAGNIANTFGPDTTFADTKIPFYCLATDFHTGEEVVLSEGNLAKAVRVSSGIPFIFKPLEMNGRLLVDGGLSNPLPIDIAIQEGADIIIAVGFETPLFESVLSPGNFASQMFNILINQLLYKKFAFYNLAYHSEIIAIVPHFEKVIRVNDVGNISFIVEQGRNETLKHIAYLKQALSRESTSESNEVI